MSRRTKPVLPGQSRSSACTKTKSCGRLVGHHGDCRPTRNAVAVTTSPGGKAAVAVTKSPVAVAQIILNGQVFDLVPASAPTKSAPTVKAAAKPVRKARRPKAARRGTATKACRVVRDGIRCGRAYGHKAAGIRHSFAGRVTVLPTVEPDRTQLIPTAKTERFHVSSKPSSRLA
jgi:hypothetical protein